ncbi:MAG: transcription-repair coupling factor [Deltaproteobacteria bacterium]|nr:transcription-repair coupling factor [Deltaproteobacteria bacterium]
MDEKFWNEEVERLSRSGPGLQTVIQEIQAGRLPFRVTGLQGSAPAYFLHQTWTQVRRPMLVVCADPEEAQNLFKDLLFFAGRDPEEIQFVLPSPILYFPVYETPDFREYVPQSETVAQRMACLYSLITRPGPVLLVTSIQALHSAVIPRNLLSSQVDYLVRKEETAREDLLSQLGRWGYLRTLLVESPGDLSVRGGIVDIFPPLHSRPVRIEFFGDQVDSIREFNPATQRSVLDLEELVLLPVSEIIWDQERMHLAGERLRQALKKGAISENEASWLKHRLDQELSFEGGERWLNWFYETPGHLKEYLPQDFLLVWNDPLSLQRGLPAEAAGPPKKFWEGWEDISGIFLEDLPVETPGMKTGPLWFLTARDNQEISRFIREPSSSKEVLQRLGAFLSAWKEMEQEIWIIVSQDPQARRLRDILSFYQLEAAYFPEQKHLFGGQSPGLRILTGRLSAGFRMKSPPLIFLTEKEIFEPKKEIRKKTRKEDLESYITSLDDLKADDFIVHKDHGIGLYRGLQFFKLNGWEGEFLFIEYAEGDKLYIPVDRLQGIHKFMGLEGQVPSLDRLGGAGWKRAKAKVKKAVEKIAQELVDLYAQRAVSKGFAFSGRDQMFKEFEAAFPYEETPDQSRVIEEVLGDMESEKPMDRLVCGDVGYGKTEVALRAAFRAVLDGKQVAVLVPTTVLAEQHYQTMSRRFEGYPVEVRILSRFKSPREQKQTLVDLKAGKVDIVIGTHRLLQKDIQFRDLGLIVVDEEHRFGVSHKERLKTLKTQVDCLTLTATPIPRTLQLSLTGIRDLSTIETPPEDRQSIRTHIIPFDEAKIVEAVRREMQRGGQVFFVHNRVHNIQSIAFFLKKILPEVRIGVGHGQLPERELEKVMLQFVRRELDLLVCTTIIESGLDIPTANTIILNQADRFGLAQMYQLRGRVGRSRERAYAYLVVQGESTLTRDAQKRLKVLMDFSELGAGFKIALHDLRIRGAGHLLGTSQSGHVAAVGYELYIQMLEQAINELKGEGPVQDWEPEIRLRVPAFIPDRYVPDPGHRLSLYKRLTSLKTEDELIDMQGEMEDRFGSIPEPLTNLLQVLNIKQKMKEIGIERIEILENDLVFSFFPGGNWKPERLVALVQQDPQTYRFKGGEKLFVSYNSERTELETTRGLMEELALRLTGEG